MTIMLLPAYRTARALIAYFGAMRHLGGEMSEEARLAANDARLYAAMRSADALAEEIEVDYKLGVITQQEATKNNGRIADYIKNQIKE